MPLKYKPVMKCHWVTDPQCGFKSFCMRSSAVYKNVTRACFYSFLFLYQTLSLSFFFVFVFFVHTVEIKVVYEKSTQRRSPSQVISSWIQNQSAASAASSGTGAQRFEARLNSASFRKEFLHSFDQNHQKNHRKRWLGSYRKQKVTFNVFFILF